MDVSDSELPRVLLVNPNGDQHVVWAPLLFYWGYDVHAFDRQAQGLRMLQQERFDVLVWRTTIRDEVSAYITHVFTTYKVPTIVLVDRLKRNVQCGRRNQTGLHAVVETPLRIFIDYLAATISDALGERDLMGRALNLPTQLLDCSPFEMSVEEVEGRTKLACQSMEQIRADAVKDGEYGRRCRKLIAYSLRRYCMKHSD